VFLLNPDAMEILFSFPGPLHMLPSLLLCAST
jgi:hypothetical protein